MRFNPRLLGLLLLAACSQEGVLLSINSEGTIAAPQSIDVVVSVDGQSAPVVTLTEKGAQPIALPTSVLLLIKGRQGAMTIDVSAKNAQGTVYATGTASGTYAAGKLHRLTATLRDGSQPQSDLSGVTDATIYDGADLVSSSDSGSPDLIPPPDLAAVVQLEPDPPTLLFPTIITGTTSVDQKITIRNTGTVTSANLNAATLAGSVGFSISTDGCMGNALSPNSSCSIFVRFSTSTPGDPSDTLTISDGTATATVMLQASAVAPGSLTWNPGDFTFAATNTGATVDKEFTLVNSGGSGSGAISLQLTGGNAGEFEVLAAGNTCQGQTLSPTATCKATVRFKPSGANNGLRSTSLRADATPGGPAIAAIQGVGLTPAKLVIEATPSPSFDFGIVDVGTPLTRTFTLRNVGGQIATLTTSMLNGGADFTFPAGSTCGATLDGEASCTFPVRFNPAGPGASSAQLVKGASGAVDVVVGLNATGRATVTLTLTKTEPDADAKVEVVSPASPTAVVSGTSTSTAVDYVTTTVYPTLQLLATGGANNQIKTWTGCTVDVNNPNQCSTVLSASKTINAEFVRSRLLTFQRSSAGGATGAMEYSRNGTVWLPANHNDQIKFPDGATAYARVLPDAGFYLSYTTVNPAMPICAESTSCTLVMDQNKQIVFGITRANRVFVTSQSYGFPAFMSASSDADITCDAAGGSGTWKAFIADTVNTSAKAKFVGSRGWVRMDGKPWLDDIQVAFYTSPRPKFFYPPEVDQTGAPHPNAPLWTGTSNGTHSNSCWATASRPGSSYYMGWSSAGDSSFEQHGSAYISCLDLNPIVYYLCLETGYSAIVRPPPPPSGAKRLFVTTGTFTPGTAGFAGAQALCTTEASAANLAGTFRPLMTNGASISSAFSYSSSTTTLVARTDGVILGSAADFFSVTNWQAPMSAGSETVWLGATSLSGSPVSECKSGADAWKATVANGSVHAASNRTIGTFQTACNSALPIVCLEE